MTRTRLTLALTPLLALAAPSAGADVLLAAPDALHVRYAVALQQTPARIWSHLVQVPRWWSSEHTWSGSPANLSLDAQAGGCFCEHWADGSAEHGRVLMALPNRLLRIEGAFGPLQEFAVTGVLGYTIQNEGDDLTRLQLDYRVTGSSASELDEAAPKVDEVLGQQFARLVRYVEHDDPEPERIEEPPATDATDAGAAARAAILEEWKRSVEADRPPTPAGIAPIEITPIEIRPTPGKRKPGRSD